MKRNAPPHQAPPTCWRGPGPHPPLPQAAPPSCCGPSLVPASLFIHPTVRPTIRLSILSWAGEDGKDDPAPDLRKLRFSPMGYLTRKIQERATSRRHKLGPTPAGQPDQEIRPLACGLASGI